MYNQKDIEHGKNARSFCLNLYKITSHNCYLITNSMAVPSLPETVFFSNTLGYPMPLSKAMHGFRGFEKNTVSGKLETAIDYYSITNRQIRFILLHLPLNRTRELKIYEHQRI